eukprot:TRINITY_DN939_c0_g1_i2.p1 TRINITY_DN939_c0_g1~~TRINITY_DN939_c0_g1_i2.p1  ORF type:complete len:288 (+),score=71.40 TRINITY_DN939_c0_g1_i2:979-1842(+)
MIGNGLRSNIWEKFKDRFNVKQIGEFYSATEGPGVLINQVDKAGSIGYFPKLVILLLGGIPLIKYDIEKEEIVKDQNGFCVRCQPGETGQFVCVIDPSKASDFRGYTNKEDSNKKILRNVFQKGDVYYLSGDLLRTDQDGFYYFVDRIGDTFRWKGENVSTGEVETIISEYPGIKEVNVYGVEMPHTFGRAGMANIIIDDHSSFDFKNFFEYTTEKLPPYAVPLFLRCSKSLEVTGTLKYLKLKKQKEGFNPGLIEDPIYFRDKEGKTFAPLTPETYQNIINLTIKM